MPSPRTPITLLATWGLTAAHSIITYPGWRGDTLHKNGSVLYQNAPFTYPYGMQWAYPCGGLPVTTNRTKWPVTGGGAVALQPGWFEDHDTAFMYVNMGMGTNPENYSLPIVPVFQITSPTNEPYPSKQICLTQIPLPANVTVKVGDNATIQVIEVAKHGAGLFNCVDITFAEPEDVAATMPVNETNCFNSSGMGFNTIFATSSLNAANPSAGSSPSILALLSLAASAVIAGLTL